MAWRGSPRGTQLRATVLAHVRGFTRYIRVACSTATPGTRFRLETVGMSLLSCSPGRPSGDGWVEQSSRNDLWPHVELPPAALGAWQHRCSPNIGLQRTRGGANHATAAEGTRRPRAAQLRPGGRCDSHQRGAPAMRHTRGGRHRPWRRRAREAHPAQAHRPSDEPRPAAHPAWLAHGRSCRGRCTALS